MVNKLKRYCIQTDSNGVMADYLREEDIYFVGERVADLNYFVIYATPSDIKKLKQYANRHHIGISISRMEPFMPDIMMPVMASCMAMTIPGRKVLRLHRSYLKYLSSKPEEPIMDEAEFIRKHYRKSKYSIIERLYERTSRKR